MSALEIAATGMLAQQLNLEVISNNLANVNTSGFKRQRAEFQDLLYQDLLRVGSTSSEEGTVVPAGVQTGLGVKISSVYRINDQGTLTQTSNPYDLAIQGGGFFKIQLPSGELAYTRAGSFQINAAGQIVTADGYTVDPGIVIPQNATAVTINKSGEVLAKIAGQTEPQNVGQLVLSTFQNVAGLEAIGDNLFLETPASGTAIDGVAGAAGFGALLQGYVEASNVNAVDEITNMITAQRAYEMLARVIETSDQMSNTLAQLR